MESREMKMRQKIQLFIQQETVLIAAFVLAVISCFFVLPDSKYADYIDWRTLTLLFCLMAVMAGVRELGIFQNVGEFLLQKVKSQQGVTAVLVALCFLSSMFITNDVALITFIPFGILVLKMAKMDVSVCLTVTLMTIAANLGSMLTPIGNPQNLYLFSVSGLTLQGFVAIMLPYTAAAAGLLMFLVGVAYQRKKICACAPEQRTPVNAGKGMYYGVLFVLCLLCVMNCVNAWVLLAVVAGSLIIVNRQLLRKIDYGLLGTFAAFFIFIGNMGRLPVFHLLLSDLVVGHEEIASIAASQLISNVPAALLLSGFSRQWSELIVGTNLGGLGTLIASMASLISYKQIVMQYPDKKKRYLIVFTIWNLVFLAVLYLFGHFGTAVL